VHTEVTQNCATLDDPVGLGRQHWINRSMQNQKSSKKVCDRMVRWSLLSTTGSIGAKNTSQNQAPPDDSVGDIDYHRIIWSPRKAPKTKEICMPSLYLKDLQRKIKNWSSNPLISVRTWGFLQVQIRADRVTNLVGHDPRYVHSCSSHESLKKSLLKMVSNTTNENRTKENQMRENRGKERRTKEA
jgi:hypothetical protein